MVRNLHVIGTGKSFTFEFCIHGIQKYRLFRSAIPQPHLVGLQWILMCSQSNQRIDEKAYWVCLSEQTIIKRVGLFQIRNLSQAETTQRRFSMEVIPVKLESSGN
jgi:hypothetical protein